MNDLIDNLMGKPDKADENLNKSLLRIQEKYKNWFEKNIGDEEDPKMRSILYYKTVYIDHNVPATARFTIDIENLPDVIWKECFESFKEAYGVTEV